MSSNAKQFLKACSKGDIDLVRRLLIEDKTVLNAANSVINCIVGSKILYCI